MTIHYTQEQMLRLLDFVGYGNLNAPMWFIGLEERGSDPHRLKARLGFKPVMDLKQAHQLLGIRKHHWPPYKPQPTWATMCRIMLGLKGAPATPLALKKHQANKLGRSKRETMLTELLPLPTPDSNSWPYASQFPQFPTRRAYKRIVRSPRIRLLNGLIRKYKPMIVVCYGRTAWRHFKEIFPGATWEKKTPLLWTKWNNTHVFLTPHFTRGYMPKESIAKLCALIRSLSPKLANQL